MTKLKTVDEVAKQYHDETNVMTLEEIITQDRANTLAVLREGVEQLRQAEWVADGESSYLEALNDVDKFLQETLGEN